MPVSLPSDGVRTVQTVQHVPDSLRQSADSVAVYDSVWSATDTAAAAPDALERVMVADGKIYVAVAVLLLIWLGLLWYIYRTDRKLDRLERDIESDGTLS